MRALTTLMTIALLCVGILAQQKPAPTPIKTTVAALIQNPDKFHRKMVQVEGKVDDLKKKTSRIGNPPPSSWTAAASRWWSSLTDTSTFGRTTP